MNSTGRVITWYFKISIWNYIWYQLRGLLLPKIVIDDHGGKRFDAGMLGSGIYFARSPGWERLFNSILFAFLFLCATFLYHLFFNWLNMIFFFWRILQSQSFHETVCTIFVPLLLIEQRIFSQARPPLISP